MTKTLCFPRPKVVFTSPTDAKRSLALDPLGCVYIRQDTVFVITAHGSGSFPISVWKLPHPADAGRA